MQEVLTMHVCPDCVLIVQGVQSKIRELVILDTFSQFALSWGHTLSSVFICLNL